MSMPLEQQQQPQPMPINEQAYNSHSGSGSVGPVIAVIAVIMILGIIAGMIGLLSSGRRIMGYGQYDFTLPSLCVPIWCNEVGTDDAPAADMAIANPAAAGKKGSEAGLGSQPKEVDPSLEVQAGDSYRTLVQKKAIARFREMS